MRRRTYIPVIPASHWVAAWSALIIFTALAAYLTYAILTR